MSFTEAQVAQLLQPINPRRVLTANKQTHVSQQDVRAHLIRVFGFGGWDKEILELTCVRDERVTVPAVPPKDGKPGKAERKNVPAVTYRCQLRLTVWCPTRCCKKVSEDVGTGTAPNLPDYGDAHDFAAKNAVSYALKRCAIDLGDQFGLSLYNKGQRSALVIGTLVGGPKRTDTAAAVDVDVPQQESLGDGEPDHDGPGPEPERRQLPWEGQREGQREEHRPSAVASSALRKALTADVNRVGTKVLDLPQADLYARFARTYGTTVVEASTEQLAAFRDLLRKEAERPAQAPAQDPGSDPLVTGPTPAPDEPAGDDPAPPEGEQG